MNGRRKTGLLLTACVTLAGLVLLLHAFADVHGATASGAGLLTDTQVPENVRHTLSAKCADCHSSQSRLPLYGHIPPMSWLLKHDITEGRKQLDLASWQTYTQEQRLDLLNRIAAEAKTGQMPPRPYTFIHNSARLTADERLAIYAWAKAERHRIRETESK